MTAFDSLHPALQHHIVNTLAWQTLRPLQEEGIEAVLAGGHTLMLAPTAGGKTEAAVFPLMSRVLSENWPGLSVLYICPIKALLNSLLERLSFYSDLVGLRCALWHGDTKAGERRRIIADPPQLLLTTPESLEVMLISARVDHRALFHDVRAVVIDEVHAFAGDDRGWHLLSVLERITRVTGRELQRIGLSATVGNPDGILEWLTGTCAGQSRVVAPEAGLATDADVQLDYVGNLENAAIVISRLHRGEKRLVFCDSRARVEKLGALLRGAGVRTFVSHSSLSADERARAEEAFSRGEDCVIVATSTLELGIDVGDLDRVIQIDAPAAVSSFLQRLGRTGRRVGAKRNCLFLATHDDALLQAAALIQLWHDGFVEPVAPPAKPAHILAQQIMALALQENGIGVATWDEWIGRVSGFREIPAEERSSIVQYMVSSGVLTDDQGILWFDREGERRFGYRNFMELCSVFTSPPLFTVLHGRDELGFVHESSFLRPEGQQCVLLLAGRSWQVTSLDWGKKRAQVKPVAESGRSRWLGTGAMLSFELCQAIRHLLAGVRTSGVWSRRATERMETLRAKYAWVADDGTFLVRAADGCRWWTFAGTRANMALANAVRSVLGVDACAEGLSVRFADGALPARMVELLDACQHGDSVFLPEADVREQLSHVKFSLCLPEQSRRGLYARRFLDTEGAWDALRQQTSTVGAPWLAGDMVSCRLRQAKPVDAPKQGRRARERLQGGVHRTQARPEAHEGAREGEVRAGDGPR